MNEDGGKIVGELGDTLDRGVAGSRGWPPGIPLAEFPFSRSSPTTKNAASVSAVKSKDLGAALAYLARLQTSSTLRYPMLDSHEVVADDKEHPVRFAMTAQWRELP